MDPEEGMHLRRVACEVCADHVVVDAAQGNVDLQAAHILLPGAIAESDETGGVAIWRG